MNKREKLELLHAAFNALKLLTNEDALAGIILTDSSYDDIKRLFGDQAQPYKPAGLDWDWKMENTFVVDGLLVLRGTKIQ